MVLFFRLPSLSSAPVDVSRMFFTLKQGLIKMFLLSLTILSGLGVRGQKIKENTIVKDSLGQVYPVALWQPLLLKGGHILKPENKEDRNTAYFLVSLSEDEKQARLEKIPPPQKSPYFRTGQKFSLGKVTDIQGNRIDLKHNQGKITVINFWFIGCLPCRLEISELNTLVEKYGSDSVRFVAVALDSKYELEDFLGRVPFKYNVVSDGLIYARSYRVQSYPTHVVISAEGKVYFHTSGLSINTVYSIEKSIKELLNKTGIAMTSAVVSH